MSLYSQYMSPTVPAGYVRHNFVSDACELYIDVLANDCSVTSAELNDSAQTKNTGLKALQSAVVLAEYETLLQSVATWFEKDTDWRMSSTSAPAANIDFTLSDNSTSSLRQLGVSVKGEVPPLPTTLDASVSLRAHRQSVRLCVSQFILNDSDASRLGPGCCVLLPNTFADTFPVKLIENHSNNEIGHGLIKASSSCIQPISSASVFEGTIDSSAQSQTLTIKLTEAVEVDIPRWQKRDKQEQHRIQSLVGQSVTVERSGCASHQAKLVQVGQGLAALFDKEV